MDDITELVLKFAETNDISQIRNSLLSMALRDCQQNPDLYKASDISEELVELDAFLGKLSK